MMSASATESSSINLVPKPDRVVRRNGSFHLDGDTRITVNTDEATVRGPVNRFVDRLNCAAWRMYSVEEHTENQVKNNAIRINLDPDTSEVDHHEGYRLSITAESVTLRAPAPAGVMYGLQTLRQLLPVGVELSDPTLVPRDTSWELPALEIEDAPRFSYRGMHLDVGRHMFPVAFIKKYLDLMALYKMNRFHWHLTEDQGWRLEVEQYPKLTEVGAWRDETQVGKTNRYDGRRYGGYYSREQVREVVQYAKDRCITVIPEIDMPGHASAALTAYPELGCNPDGSYRVSTSWGVKNDVYCPREKTFSFLEDVLAEVMELFPGEYIHLGGDEVPQEQWKNCEVAQRVMEREGLGSEQELHSYFIERIGSVVNRDGRRVIGWDEILEGGSVTDATVMSWRGIETGISAVRSGHDVIMTPASHCYLDHYQGNEEREPIAIGGFTPLRKVYAFDPVPDELEGNVPGRILGLQGNVWTEFMKSAKKVEYMAYPRALALAEVAWSSPERRNWDDFWTRLQSHFQRLQHLDVNSAEQYRGVKDPDFGGVSDDHS